ncbi:tyrosine-protein kinase SRK2-like [Sycon ciliatum]|uniref:tyrosine-protein kinase SRK2-like n=1 Tax=Sycon ciliatum TaxID=27933 RepID=UPI0020AC59CD|eukprot:scpid46392/ scgid34136/ Tyrosine-protein kinase Src42A; Tyrosine-protein kinase Src41
MGCCTSEPIPSSKPSIDAHSTTVPNPGAHRDPSGFNASTNLSNSNLPPPNQPPPKLPIVTATSSGSGDLQPSIASSKLFVALFDYEARVPEDLTFKKNDLLELVNGEDPNWWLARHTRTQKEGFIPSNFVAKAQSIDAQPWFFQGFRRADAEKALSLCGKHGAFLVRNSETSHGEYSVSVRDHDAIKHYRIKRNAETGKYYVSRQAHFDDIISLVEFYKLNPDVGGLRLKFPCDKLDTPTPFSLSHRDEWEIDRTSLEFTKKLGAGQFGEVWQAQWNNTTDVAVKMLKEESMERQAFIQEAQLMKDLQHPKLIRLYAVCTVGEPILIVTELMSNGCLLDYLRLYKTDLRMPHLVDMAYQIAQGMSYLETKNYIHRDLAARNILVGEHNTVKIADFGLARIITSEYIARAGAKFPIKWTAPEAALYSRFSNKSDVWSFGILMVELFTKGQKPYPAMNNAETLKRIEEGYRIPQPTGTPDPIYQMMLDSWHDEAANRPTFESLMYQLEDFVVNDKTYLEAVEALNGP